MCLEPGGVASRLFGIMRGRQAERRLLRISQRPDQPGRRADDQAALLEPLALGDQRIGPDQAFRARETRR